MIVKWDDYLLVTFGSILVGKPLSGRDTIETLSNIWQ
mgnify:FL=1